MSEAVAKKPKWRVPVMEGILPIDGKRVPVDVIAGITLAALAIPEVMGYAKIAGMPVITGLYTILIPILVFALLGSSRHLVVGADSATAAILYAGIIGLGIAEGSPQWIALAGWLALLAAVFLLAARLFKLGFLADFLSRTVLIGFLTGVGVQVACGQMAGMLGVTKTGHGPILQAFNAIKDIPQANPATVAVSASVLVIILGGKLISKKVPWPLIAVIGAIVASAWLDLAAKGVSTLGPVPSGLPQFGIPTMPTSGQWMTLIGTAASLALVILAQSAATSRAYAVKFNDADFSENTDLVGLGLANVAAGLSGTFVVNGSPTKTEMLDSAGGQSQISSLTVSAIVLIVILFLTKPLSYMPNAVLASVVFLIGVELVDVKGMIGILRTRSAEFWVALITAAVVVGVGVEQGIILAIALSLIVHVRHSYRPLDFLLAFTKGERAVRPIDAPLDEAETEPGLVIYHFGASLYYANADTLQSELLDLAGRLKPRWIAFEAGAVGDVDYSAAETIRETVPLLKERGVTLVMCEVAAPVLAEFRTSEVLSVVGEENVYDGVLDVIRAYRALPPRPADPDDATAAGRADGKDVKASGETR